MSGGAALFVRDGARWVPSAHAVGPWDPAQLHGGAPAALVADAVQALAPEMQVVRCSCEFLGPVPLSPLEVTVAAIKPGRRVLVAEGEVRAGGRAVLLVRTMLMRRGEPMALPAGAEWPDGLPCEGPDESRGVAFPGQEAGAPGFHRTAMEIRFADATSWGDTRALAWLRLAHPLVEGRPLTPVARAVAAADFGNGVSSVLGFGTHLFVNTDLTVTLLRDPEGPWVLLDARTRIDPLGIGWASSVLHDARGPIGFAQQSLFVAER